MSFKIAMLMVNYCENLVSILLSQVYKCLSKHGTSFTVYRGGSRIFFRRGCTRLLLYFNTSKLHSFFFAEYQLYYKTAGHLRGGGGAYPLHPPPRSAPGITHWTQKVKKFTWESLSDSKTICLKGFFLGGEGEDFVSRINQVWSNSIY